MKKPTHFDLYRARNGEWRWRLLAGNGKIIADSAEGYSSRLKCRVAIYRTADAAWEAAVDRRINIIDVRTKKSGRA